MTNWHIFQEYLFNHIQHIQFCLWRDNKKTDLNSNHAGFLTLCTPWPISRVHSRQFDLAGGKEMKAMLLTMAQFHDVSQYEVPVRLRDARISSA